MSTWTKLSRVSMHFTVSATMVLLVGCSTMQSWVGMGTKLSGSQEVPAVNTAASGTSNIKVNKDRSVSGTVSVSGIKPTAAHIHEGAPGKNGGVIIPLTKNSDTMFTVPAGAKLTDAQYKTYKAGGLYVNVHSAAYPNGEIRAQLKP
jgi:hypothetical protein